MQIEEIVDLPWKIPIPETIEIIFENQLLIYEDPQLTSLIVSLILSILDWDYHIGIEH